MRNSALKNEYGIIAALLNFQIVNKWSARLLPKVSKYSHLEVDLKLLFVKPSVMHSRAILERRNADP